MPDVLDAAGVTPRNIRRYGWKPSLPDLRDHVADASELKVLDEVDPRADLPDVFDQGQLGSCTANAVAAAVQYDAKLNGSDPGFLSRLWIYYYERKIEGSPADQDTGANGRDGFKVCQKSVCPWRPTGRTTSPSSPRSRRPASPRRPGSTASRTTGRCRETSTRSRRCSPTGRRSRSGSPCTSHSSPKRSRRRGSFPCRPGMSGPWAATRCCSWVPKNRAQLRAGAQLMGYGLGHGGLLPDALGLHHRREPRQRLPHDPPADGSITRSRQGD